MQMKPTQPWVTSYNFFRGRISSSIVCVLVLGGEDKQAAIFQAAIFIVKPLDRPSKRINFPTL